MNGKIRATSLYYALKQRFHLVSKPIKAVKQAQSARVRTFVAQTNHCSSCLSVGRRRLPLMIVLVGVLREGYGIRYLIVRTIILGKLFGCCVTN